MLELFSEFVSQRHLLECSAVAATHVCCLSRNKKKNRKIDDTAKRAKLASKCFYFNQKHYTTLYCAQRTTECQMRIQVFLNSHSVVLIASQIVWSDGCVRVFVCLHGKERMIWSEIVKKRGKESQKDCCVTTNNNNICTDK